MMSMSAFSFAASSMSFLKARVPDWAMTPRLFSISSAVMPMPLSETVRTLFSRSAVRRMKKSLRSMPTLSSVRDRKHSLSMASEALEISSRRKISWWV